jgi:hypothetical protein
VSQRRSGYPRRLADDYPTPAWATLVVVPYLRPRIDHACDPAEGEGAMVRVLNQAGVPTIGTGGDFLAQTRLPDPRINTVITNPPYGYSGKLARQFIEHALELVPIVSMLLRVDFDSGRTRPRLFRNCPAFAASSSCSTASSGFPANTQAAPTIPSRSASSQVAASQPALKPLCCICWGHSASCSGPSPQNHRRSSFQSPYDAELRMMSFSGWVANGCGDPAPAGRGDKS